MNRTRMIIIGIVVLVGGVALSFPLWSPYFIDEAVDEAFPAVSNVQADIPATSVADAEPATQEATVAATNNAVVEQATNIAPTEAPPAEPTVAAEPQAVVMGEFNFIDGVHNGEGTATVYQLPDGSRVLRFENFRVTNGPDLHVYLSKISPTGLLDGVGDDAIDLGALKGNVGNQNYDIPEGVDISEYQSVVIYCVPFHVVFSAAAFQ